jgi:inosine/guanosine/xanthosine phosphorylase family protein
VSGHPAPGPAPHGRRVALPPDDRSNEAAASIAAATGVRPVAAVVLGSGLSEAFAPPALESDAEFDYASLLGFPPPAVPGHAGRLTVGSLFGVPAAVFFGRTHFYEGHGMGGPTLIPRLAAAIGAQVLMLSNAAGGLDADMRPGDLMLLTDHINLMGANPLTGWRFPDGAPAFVDLTTVYDPDLQTLAIDRAREAGIPLRTGVYAAFPGPSYETPAEHGMARTLGASAVGMSTVPEAVAAAAVGLRTVAVSCITNLAGEPASHEEVLRAALAASADLARLFAGILGGLPRPVSG